MARRNLISKEFTAACEATRDTWSAARGVMLRLAEMYTSDGKPEVASAYQATAEMFAERAVQVAVEYKAITGKELGGVTR